MKKRRFSMIAWMATLAVLLAPPAVRAQDSAPATPAPEQTAPNPESPAGEPAESGEPEQPEQPAWSSIEDLRNPFWPVGFTPPREGERIVLPDVVEPDKNQPEPPKWDEATKQLGIKGVMAMAADKYMAVVNNQIVREGDIVMVIHKGKRYRWKVHAITKGGVRFEPLDVVEAGAPQPK
ncbi:MAG: hypothetical protein JXB04_10115 [Kiritimatiellae bacterium]|nr:hypothetical protein [Kiritimatiellia bacterium]